MAKPVENGFEEAHQQEQEEFATPVKSKADPQGSKLPSNRSSSSRASIKASLLSEDPSDVPPSPSSSSSTSELQIMEPGIKQFLLDALAPVADALSSTIASSATNSVTTESSTTTRQEDEEEPLSYYSQLSPIEHAAPLVDHSACNKSKAQKKQEKKERKKELKRERQEVQQNRLLEQQQQEQQEEENKHSQSPLWDLLPSALAGVALSAVEPFVTPYTTSSYLYEESEVLDDYDDEEEDDFSFENLEAIKIKKSSRKKSFKQSSSSPNKKKTKKKNKLKRRGRRADFEELFLNDEGEESATDTEEVDSAAAAPPTVVPPKMDVAARVEAIFANKDLILKDFDDYIERTAEDLKVIEPKQQVRGRRSRSNSTSAKKMDRRGRSRSAGMNAAKKVRSKSVGASYMSEKSRSKSRHARDDSAIVAQSFDDSIEIMLADTSRSLLNRKGALESSSGRSKSESGLGKPQRRGSNPVMRGRRDKNKNPLQPDETLEILLGLSKKKDKNRSTKSSLENDIVATREERTTEESTLKPKKESKEAKGKEHAVMVEPAAPHHRRMRSNSFTEGKQLALPSTAVDKRPRSLVDDADPAPKDRRQSPVHSLPSIERKERTKKISSSPKPKSSRRAPVERSAGEKERSSFTEEEKKSTLKHMTSTPKPRVSRRASERNFSYNAGRKGRSVSPKQKTLRRPASQMNFTDHGAKSETKPSKKDSKKGNASRSRSINLIRNLGIELKGDLTIGATASDDAFEKSQQKDRCRKDDKSAKHGTVNADSNKSSPSKSIRQSALDDEEKTELSRSKNQNAQRGHSTHEEFRTSPKNDKREDNKKSMEEGAVLERRRRTIPIDYEDAPYGVEEEQIKGDYEGALATDASAKRDRSRSNSHSARRRHLDLEESDATAKASKKRNPAGSKPRSRTKSTDEELDTDSMLAPQRNRGAEEEAGTQNRKYGSKRSSKNAGSEDAKQRDRSRSKSQSTHRRRVPVEEATGTAAKSSETEEGKKKTRRKSTDQTITLDLLQDFSEPPQTDTPERKKTLGSKDRSEKGDSEELKLKKKSNKKASRGDSVRELDDLNLDNSAPMKTKSSKKKRVRSLELGSLISDDEDEERPAVPSRKGKKSPSHKSNFGGSSPLD